LHNIKITMDLTKRIGQRLRSARHEQKLSLADLSARTNSLSKSRISNYEQGIRRMGLEEAHELSVALGTVTPTYLLCLDDRGPFSDPELELIDHFRRTDDRGRETVLAVAQSQPDHVPAEKADSESESQPQDESEDA
jgi:transcriptional regulator with XRE-family HTH domain